MESLGRGLGVAEVGEEEEEEEEEVAADTHALHNLLTTPVHFPPSPTNRELPLKPFMVEATNNAKATKGGERGVVVLSAAPCNPLIAHSASCATVSSFPLKEWQVRTAVRRSTALKRKLEEG